MKNSYILLRNNIESSSLSFNELKEIGLETSDLIWVECQSVFWQNPSEISELKPLLINKKTRNKENEPVNEVKNNTQHQNLKPINNMDDKSIFVEMPTPEKVIEKKPATVTLQDSSTLNMNKYGNPGNSNKTSTAKNIFELNTRYSKPHNSIKEDNLNKPVQKTDQQSVFNKINLPEQAKKIALYAGLFIAGALVMLVIINAGNTNKKEIIVQQTTPRSDVINTTATIIPAEDEEYNTSTPESYEQKDIPVDEIINIPVQQQKSKIAVNKNMSVDKIDEKTTNSEIINEKASVQKQTVTETKTAKPILVENLIPKLRIKANNYKVGSFGGIRNLEMTLQNDSKYPIDKVTVEIEYLNPEGNKVNSDKIYFSNLQPGDETTIPVKKSTRGVKISYTITSVESKVIARNNSNPEDSNNFSKN